MAGRDRECDRRADVCAASACPCGRHDGQPELAGPGRPVGGTAGGRRRRKRRRRCAPGGVLAVRRGDRAQRVRSRRRRAVDDPRGVGPRALAQPRSRPGRPSQSRPSRRPRRPRRATPAANHSPSTGVTPKASTPAVPVSVPGSVPSVHVSVPSLPVSVPSMHVSVPSMPASVPGPPPVSMPVAVAAPPAPVIVTMPAPVVRIPAIDLSSLASLATLVQPPAPTAPVPPPGAGGPRSARMAVEPDGDPGIRCPAPTAGCPGRGHLCAHRRSRRSFGARGPGALHEPDRTATRRSRGLRRPGGAAGCVPERPCACSVPPPVRRPRSGTWRQGLAGCRQTGDRGLGRRARRPRPSSRRRRSARRPPAAVPRRPAPGRVAARRPPR